ncbi:putative trehalose-6-phosphate synthase/trehalose phosphatase [Purpureocillium lavendulum]|uniref:Trehalose-6-phosphate synthase/trehalose phosphatase n=1 Tax=Purpureocillium lavendulum TaxID=1247861 RepID=A0AB34FPM2_9HYPO|nr:putative trehalose-6-phosphate synthase/trehalose phosphatase [Purpureocillium lavendulum]
MPQNYPQELDSVSRWKAKVSLRAAAAFLWITALILIIKPATDGNILAIAILAAPAGLSFLWDVAETICLLVGNKRGIHPGACVGVDLILSLGSFVAIVIVGILWTAWTREEYPTDEREADEVRGLTTAALVLGGIATAIRVSLLVIACVETHRYNKAAKAAFAATAKAQEA